MKLDRRAGAYVLKAEVKVNTSGCRRADPPRSGASGMGLRIEGTTPS